MWCGLFGMAYGLPLVILQRNKERHSETANLKTPGLVDSLTK